MHAHAAPGGTRPAPAHPCAPATNYLMVPAALLADHRDSPVAVGLWCLIGRLYFVAQAPIPLSAADARAYDPALSRGAVGRAFDRLTRTGYLIASEQPGRKTSYVPAWGVVRGRPCAWDFDAATLGRPRHRTAIRIDRRLLDTYIGRLTPHPQHPADIRRWVTAPLLGLADVGAYALAALSYAAPTQRLLDWGLARGAEVRRVPDDERILAHASQLALATPDAATLTPLGLARLGLPAPVQTSQPEDTGRPLLFLPADYAGQLIGGVIGGVIGRVPEREHHPTASQCPQVPSFVAPHMSTGNLENQRNQENPPSTKRDITKQGGGTSLTTDHVLESCLTAPQPRRTRTRQPEHIPEPQTPAAKRLRELNVRPAIVAELAGTPLEIVEAALRDGQARPGVRDLGGWVVSLVRDARRHGWKIQAPRRSDVVDWGEVIAKARADGLIADEGATPAGHPSDECRPLPPLAPEILRERVLGALGRSARGWAGDVVSRIDIRVEEGVVSVVCRRPEDRLEAEALLPSVEAILARFGWQGGAQLICAPPAAPAPPEPSLERPAWIPAERWEGLAPLLRALLAGSTCEAGRVRAASPYAAKQLEGRYAGQVAALVGMVS